MDREFRTWKRYKGGRATELWSYDLTSNRAKQLTHWAGSDQWPVWEGDHIYYASDRDTRLNIWRHDLLSGEEVQVTRHTDFDVMWPSGDNGRLVYENGGHLYLLDLASGDSRRVTVAIHYDNPHLHSSFKNVKMHVAATASHPPARGHSLKPVAISSPCRWRRVRSGT